MTTEVLNVIERSKLFEGLAPALLKKIANAADRLNAGAGELLFQQGDQADAVWGVLSGRVLETIRNEDGHEMTVETIAPGEIFGEIAILDWGTQRFEAIAAEDSVLFSISRRQFLELLQASPELCFRVFRLLCSQVRGTTEALEDATLQTFPVRLAKKLTILAGSISAEPSQVDGTDGIQEIVTLRVSQNELAQLSGAKRETVNRHLRSWEKQGWLTLGRKKIVINNMAKLTSLAAPAISGKGLASKHHFFTNSKSKPGAGKAGVSDDVRQVGLIAFVVSDYSYRMMGDAAGTLKSLRDGIAVIEKIVVDSGGSIIGQVGDSIVVELPESGLALQTAKLIQRKLVPFIRATNSSKGQPTGLFRIGVHTGKIIGEDSRSVGPAISIVLSLAQYARPGELYLSRDVKDQMGDDLHDEISFLGNQKFPGITEMVPVYSEKPVTFSKRVLAHVDSVRKRRLWPVTLIGATTVLLVVVWLTAQQFQPPAIVAIPPKSIAVLPFEDLSPDQADAFLADGLSTELMQVLASHVDLMVTGRESVQNYLAREEVMSDIGEGLPVAFLLDGSVSKSGFNFTITARLTRTSDGNLVWSGSYDRDTRDLFTVQQEIAAKVASALELDIKSPEEAGLILPMSSNPEAYSLFLQARYHYSFGMTANVLEGIPLLEQAIGLDPEFAEAHALLARMYLGVLASDNNMPFSPEERDEKIRTAMAKALALKPNSPKVLAAASTVMWIAEDFEGALQMAERAVTLDPNDTDALWTLSSIYWVIGDWASSFKILEKLITLEPLSTKVLVQYGRFLAVTNRLDEAWDVAERARILSPDPRGPLNLLSGIALSQDDPVEAVFLSREARPIGISLDLWFGLDALDIEAIRPNIFKVGLYTYVGDYDMARKVIIETYSKTPEAPEYLINRGEIEILAGNYEAGIEFFDQARPLLPNGDNELISPKKVVFWASGNRKSTPADALLFAYRQTGQDAKADALAVLIVEGFAPWREKLNSIGGVGETDLLYQEAQFLAIEGQNQAALETLSRWRIFDPGQFNYLRSDPFFVGLHNEAAFWEIVAELEAELAAIRVDVETAEATGPA